MNNENLEIKNSKSNKNINFISLESNKLLLVDSILEKWSKLQKAIKERIILKDVILKQQEIDFNQLKDHFIEYYNIKLKIRQTYEEIEMLKDNKKNYKHIFFKKNAEEIFLKSLEPIKDILFTFRNNYDYVIKLIESIELENGENNNINNLQINSVIELLCSQFYDNILIPNPDQEELLILIYKLLERDISKMNSISLDAFLNENTFLGIFIKYLMRKSELKIFLSKLLTPIILSIENDDDKLDTKIFSLEKNNNNSNKSNKKSNNKNEKEDMNKLLFNEIPKTKVKFKNFLELEEQQEKESKRKNSLLFDELVDDNDNEDSTFGKNSLNTIFNDEYKEELSEEKISQKIDNEKNKDLKDFYLILLEQIKREPNIFNNSSLISILEEEKVIERQETKANELKNIFLYIKTKIDMLMQSLIDKIAVIPYIMKIICKMILMLISLKFPDSPKYILNSFIGKFIFEKCILSALLFENNNIKEYRIFSSTTKNILKIIVDILSKAIKCSLFNSNEDPIKTIFNYYMIEIIPLLNEFYNKLVDVKYPNVLNSLIKKKMKNKTNSKKTKLYKYFKENNDEILQLQCICSCIDDILCIIKIINKNEANFKTLKNSEKFFNSLNLIETDILQEISNNETDTSIFFVLFNDKYNPKLNKLITKDDMGLLIKKPKINVNEEELKNRRFKLCITNILQGLNSISSKSYTYLNMAISNDIFFTLLQYMLEDIEELNNKNDSQEIPLKWYCQYINSNKKVLDSTYKENDYEKLYNEINKEELDKLKELYDFSEIIISRDGMNLRCCEKIIENTKNELFHIEQAKKYEKIEKFIDSEKIEVCIRIKNNNIYKEIEALKKLQKKKQKKTSFFSFGKKVQTKEENIEIDTNPSTIIVTQDFSYCPHKNKEFIEKSKKNSVGCLILNEREIIPSHSFYIKDFIQKFSDNPWGEDITNKDKKPKDIIIQEIIKGERNEQVYKTFQNYMDIIRKRIKTPSDMNKNIFRNITKKECENVVEIIENFILNQIYKDIYPSECLKEDKEFYEKSKCLDWILPKHLEIQKYYIDQLGMAELCLKNFDTAKSLFDKLEYIKDAFTNINNNIKYSEGKNEEAGQDEMIPIFQYILIKAQLKRMRTNLNYINCFLSEELYNGQFGYFVSQIESSFTFIMNINHNVLNMTKEEFDRNYENAKKRHNIE